MARSTCWWPRATPRCAVSSSRLLPPPTAKPPRSPRPRPSVPTPFRLTGSRNTSAKSTVRSSAAATAWKTSRCATSTSSARARTPARLTPACSRASSPPCSMAGRPPPSATASSRAILLTSRTSWTPLCAPRKPPAFPAWSSTGERAAGSPSIKRSPCSRKSPANPRTPNTSRRAPATSAIPRPTSAWRGRCSAMSPRSASKKASAAPGTGTNPSTGSHGPAKRDRGPSPSFFCSLSVRSTSNSQLSHQFPQVRNQQIRRAQVQPVTPQSVAHSARPRPRMARGFHVNLRISHQQRLVRRHPEPFEQRLHPHGIGFFPWKTVLAIDPRKTRHQSQPLEDRHRKAQWFVRQHRQRTPLQLLERRNHARIRPREIQQMLGVIFAEVEQSGIHPFLRRAFAQRLPHQVPRTLADVAQHRRIVQRPHPHARPRRVHCSDQVPARINQSPVEIKSDQPHPRESSVASRHIHFLSHCKGKTRHLAPTTSAARLLEWRVSCRSAGLHREPGAPMARIFPFRAFRYDAARFDLARVLTQPYDKITPEMQERYYALDPHNLVGIEKGRAQPDDGPQSSVYTRAAQTLDALIREGVLRQDAAPSLYVCSQEFTAPGTGQHRVRRGFLALLGLEDYAAGVVFRHEQTHTAARVDRLELLRH